MVTYRLIQEGMVVVGVSGPEEEIWREVNQYAAVYSKDGIVEIQIKKDKRWVKVP